jgi:HPr Serine kinase C-terminal domain
LAEEDTNIEHLQGNPGLSRKTAMSGFPSHLLGARITVDRCAVEVNDPLLRITAADPEIELQATRERAHLRIPGVGAIAAEHGTQVCVDPASDAAVAELQAWLFSTITALLLAQRGRFALHSTVVDVRGAGIALAGLRGAGKSTTALRLVQRGHQLIADDVAPLRLDRRATVTPYGRPVRVTRETADAIGLDLSEAVPLSDGESKLELPAPPSREAPLDAIVVLRPEPGAHLAATVQSGVAAAALVAENVYRAEILASIYAREIFEWAAIVAAQAKVFVLRRPDRGWTLDPLCSAIEELADRDYLGTVAV